MTATTLDVYRCVDCGHTEPAEPTRGRFGFGPDGNHKGEHGRCSYEWCPCKLTAEDVKATGTRETIPTFPARTPVGLS